ncbi:hypothetical protein ISN44_As12g033130 [Arabidopsis suecica]|uniref:MD-2-related lipid-recognition domain-containing protein n=1 Tax=Arabidopsis suecica TaxID=45249 RepID=A0A8T1YQ30_ARASU|nr:hypothetical protein ISN44_As12g033130 [Arabidopsis suecica]
MRIFAILPFAISLLLLVSPIVQAIDVFYFDERAQYQVLVKDITISPVPIVPGKQAAFTCIFQNTGHEISFGVLHIDVSYFRVQVYSEDHDLCIETDFPIQNGDFIVGHSQVLLPAYTPLVSSRIHFVTKKFVAIIWMAYSVK